GFANRVFSPAPGDRAPARVLRPPHQARRAGRGRPRPRVAEGRAVRDRGDRPQGAVAVQAEVFPPRAEALLRRARG
ncbi:MAG: hypothetical protein AVDCRST_MAG64-2933, partial [uncultured Phycisphaerae bacterium]